MVVPDLRQKLRALATLIVAYFESYYFQYFSLIDLFFARASSNRWNFLQTAWHHEVVKVFSKYNISISQMKLKINLPYCHYLFVSFLFSCTFNSASLSFTRDYNDGLSLWLSRHFHLCFCIHLFHLDLQSYMIIVDLANLWPYQLLCCLNSLVQKKRQEF